MRKTMAVLLLLVVAVLYSGEELDKSDWQHIYIPGTAYIAGEQFLETIGCSRETSEYGSLSLVLMANIGKEYYDYRKGGVSSLTDLELSVIGIVTSYYVNKGLNALFRGSRGNEKNRTRMTRIGRISADNRGKE